MQNLAWVATMISRHGWIWLVSLVWPVYWSQDVKMVNKGYDLISVKDPKCYWMRGTYWEMQEELNQGKG